jgi:hypothetical protein
VCGRRTLGATELTAVPALPQGQAKALCDLQACRCPLQKGPVHIKDVQTHVAKCPQPHARQATDLSGQPCDRDRWITTIHVEQRGKAAENILLPFFAGASRAVGLFHSCFFLGCSTVRVVQRCYSVAIVGRKMVCRHEYLLYSAESRIRLLGLHLDAA